MFPTFKGNIHVEDISFCCHLINICKSLRWRFCLVFERGIFLFHVKKSMQSSAALHCVSVFGLAGSIMTLRGVSYGSTQECLIPPQTILQNMKYSLPWIFFLRMCRTVVSGMGGRCILLARFPMKKCKWSMLRPSPQYLPGAPRINQWGCIIMILVSSPSIWYVLASSVDFKTLYRLLIDSISRLGTCRFRTPGKPRHSHRGVCKAKNFVWHSMLIDDGALLR